MEILRETRGRISGADGAAARLGIAASTIESRIRTFKINKHRIAGSLGKALDDSSDIRGRTLSQLCGFEHIRTWTEPQDNEAGMVFVFELGAHGNPSLRVAVLRGFGIGKTSPRLHIVRCYA